MSCVCHAFASALCCLVVTGRERAGLLTLICDVYCDFVTVPFWYPGQVWYLIVSIPDPFCLPYYVDGTLRCMHTYFLFLCYFYIMEYFWLIIILPHQEVCKTRRTLKLHEKISAKHKSNGKEGINSSIITALERPGA